jgi:hypothetical protein
LLGVNPAAVLAACGGGGGTSSLTLTRTVATGAAIAAATVEARCAVGTSTATTSTDGSYSMTIKNGTAPCLLQVSPRDASALYSILERGATTANLTPLTQMIVARLLGVKPAQFSSSFQDVTIDPGYVMNAKSDILAQKLADVPTTIDAVTQAVADNKDASAPSSAACCNLHLRPVRQCIRENIASLHRPPRILLCGAT